MFKKLVIFLGLSKSSTKLAFSNQPGAALPATDDIFDIRGIIETPFSLPWWAWALIVLKLILVVVGIYFFAVQSKRNKQTKTTLLSPYDQALIELGNISKSLKTQADKDFSIQLSNALRYYLERELNAPAPERTTEEFLNEITNFSNLGTHTLEILSRFLAQCDLAKFAKERLNQETRSTLLNHAKQVIKEIHTQKTQVIADEPQ